MATARIRRPLLDIAGIFLFFIVALLMLFIDYMVYGLQVSLLRVFWWFICPLLFLGTIVKITYPPLMIKNTFLYITLDKNIIPRRIPLQKINNVKNDKRTIRSWSGKKESLSLLSTITIKSGKNIHIKFTSLSKNHCDEIENFFLFLQSQLQESSSGTQNNMKSIR